jgi:hypothetical protein
MTTIHDAAHSLAIRYAGKRLMDQVLGRFETDIVEAMEAVTAELRTVVTKLLEEEPFCGYQVYGNPCGVCSSCLALALTGAK